MEVLVDKNASLRNNFTSLPNNSTSQPATIATVLFSSVIATGFPGNVLIVWAIINRQQLRTPCYWLILSIAIADLGMAPDSCTTANYRELHRLAFWWISVQFSCVHSRPFCKRIGRDTHCNCAGKIPGNSATIQDSNDIKDSKTDCRRNLAWVLHHRCFTPSADVKSPVSSLGEQTVLFTRLSLHDCKTRLPNLSRCPFHRSSFIYSIVVLYKYIHSYKKWAALL